MQIFRTNTEYQKHFPAVILSQPQLNYNITSTSAVAGFDKKMTLPTTLPTPLTQEQSSTVAFRSLRSTIIAYKQTQCKYER